MNLNQLRVFAAVAAEQSITRAARRLRISQPAVSKQLAELEISVGTTLVDRMPRGIRLTEAGRILDEHARRIFQSEAAAEAELASLLGLARGQLAIAASTTIGNYLIPDLFGKYHRAHPTVRLDLEIGNTAQVQTWVRDGDIDFGFTEGFAAAEGLETEVIAHDEMVMIVAPGDPLRDRGPLFTKDLESIPLLMREHGSGTRDVIEAALGERGVAVAPLMSLGSSEALKHAVAAGVGAAIISRLAVELELRLGLLTEVTVTDLRIHRALHLLRLRGKTPSPAASEFLKLLREALKTS